jgi:hypothetical protein
MWTNPTLLVLYIQVVCGCTLTPRIVLGVRGTLPFVRRSPLVLATESGRSDSDDSSTISTSSTSASDLSRQEKRLRAERLALQAERAALELAALELDAAQLRREAESLAPREAPPAAAATAPISGSVTASETPAAATKAPGAPGSASPIEQLLASLKSNSSTDAGASRAGGPSKPPPSLSGSSLTEVLSGQSEGALQLSEAQVSLARNRVFDYDTFYVSQVEQSFIGTIFRGNLRTNTSVVYARVSAKAAAEPELAGIQFLLLQDPLALTLEGLQAGEERKPVFLALPARATALRQRIPELSVVLLGAAASVITTLGFALSVYILADGGAMLEQISKGDPAPVEAAFPIAIGLGALQLAHELGHLVAARVHGMRTGVPLPIPSLQIGNFGCITKLLTFPRSRTALFDFALAGPALATALGLVLYLVGLALSIDLPVPSLPAGLLDPAAAASAAEAASTASTIAGSTAAASAGAATGTFALASAAPSAALAAVGAPAAADAAAAAATTAAAAASSGGGEIFPVVPSDLLLSSLLLGSIAQVRLATLIASDCHIDCL